MERAPLFFHIHLPRTGGTSLNSLLRQWFGDAFFDWYDPDPGRIYSAAEIEQQIASRPQVGCIASHSIRNYPNSVCGRPAYYMTLLREPLDRMISNSTYTQKTYETFSAQHKGSLPREFSDATAVDILNYWLERAESLKGTDTLVGDPICHFYAAAFIARRQRALARLNRLGSLAAIARWLIRREAIAMLNGFFFVGLTAQFSRDVALLARLLQSFGIAAAPDATARLNRSDDLRAGLDTAEARDILRRLERFCPGDELLYRTFSTRMVSRARPDGLRR